MIRTWLRRLMCEHKNQRCVEQISTEHERLLKDDDPSSLTSWKKNIIYLWQRSSCQDCGKSNIIFTYRA